MSTLEIILVVISGVLAVAWGFVTAFFWRSWRIRKSPLSIAICAMTAYPIFTNASAAIFLYQDSKLSISLMLGTNTLLLINFALCFKWQNERFADSRSRSPRGTPRELDDAS